jgi:hypothetical protein
MSGNYLVEAPANLTAMWLHEYFVNVSSSYGNATGGGWYEAGSYANLSVPNPIVNVSPGIRLAFISWSNGNKNGTMREEISSPTSLSARFGRQYLLDISAKDSQGNPISVSYFVINGNQSSGSAYLSENSAYSLTGAYYKGVLLPENLTLQVSHPSTVNVSLPVYDVKVRTTDLFGLPVNASVTLVYKNATSSQAYSGSAGTLQVADVPYGASNVAASYSGVTVRASTLDGNEASMVFVSMTDVVVVAVLLAVAAVAALRFKRRPPRRGREPYVSEAESG